MTKTTEHSFNDAYKLYRYRVFGMAFKILKDIQLAEDVTQDVFIKFLKQPKESIEEYKIQWLCVVTRNTSLKVAAKAKKLELCGSFGSLNSEQFFLKSGPFHVLENCKPINNEVTVCVDNPRSLLSNAERSSDRGRATMEAVAKLPPRLQKLLKLRFFDQLSYAEIAKKTKLSKGNVGFLLNKATTTLRKTLKNERRNLNEV